MKVKNAAIKAKTAGSSGRLLKLTTEGSVTKKSY